MKLLPILCLFLLFVIETSAQTSRWMYLAKAKDITIMVDTLTRDVKQMSSYDLHSNITLIWVKLIKGNIKNSDTTVARFAMDTSINQFEVVSATVYRKNNSIQSNNNDHHLEWQDVIPESFGEALINYSRALNDPKLMHTIIYNAGLNDISSLPKKDSN